jgi:hypothetical protein
VSYAPIAVFAYARPDHLRRTIESLSANPEFADSPIFIYCDGPRQEADKSQTDAVRAYVDSLAGGAVKRVYRDNNIGLAKSIILGVTDVLKQYDSVIVMEDDLVVSPHFLRYMNDGLHCYRGQDRVASIHGYCFPVDDELPETYFLRGADCWGWATWRRAWQHFEPDGQHLLDALRRERLTHAFDLGGTYPYTNMLSNQVAGKNDSWAVRWHASCFLKNMLTLYPGRSLVNNIGTDDSGTHCSATDEFFQTVSATPVRVSRIALESSKMAEASIEKYLRKNRSVSARMIRKLRFFFGVS